MKKAIVLFSGGQDSTTCLFWAKKNFDHVEAIGFNYGQKHAEELEQAKLIAELAEVKYEILDLQGLLGGSSLTDHSLDVNSAHKKNKDLPSSFTAGRNILFLTLAASYAHQHDIKNIVTGVCQTDYSGYPDCRHMFIKSMESSLNFGLGVSDLRIHVPLMYLTKAETWQLAQDLSDGTRGLTDISDTVAFKIDTEAGSRYNVVEIVRRLTLTDYNGDRTLNDWGMGKEDNPASQLRAKGFREAQELNYI